MYAIPTYCFRCGTNGAEYQLYLHIFMQIPVLCRKKVTFLLFTPHVEGSYSLLMAYIPVP